MCRRNRSTSSDAARAARQHGFGASEASVRAHGIDAAAVALVRGQGVLELALGEVLCRLFFRPNLVRRGYSKWTDCARELGVPARLARYWVRLARGLAERPILRRAVAAGLVSARKALAISKVAAGRDELAWTAAAMSCTLERLEKAVRSGGAEPPEAEYEPESLLLKMTAPQQDRLDAAVAEGRECGLLRYGSAPWQGVEAVCMEWLGSHGEWAREEGERGEGGPPPHPPLRDVKECRRWRKRIRRQAKGISRQIRAVEEATGVVERLAGIEEEAAAADLGSDAVALEALVLRLFDARRRFDLAFCPLAAALVEGQVHRCLGYRNFDHYCRERLGMTGRAVRERARLEWKMRVFPALRDALASGRLTYSKALLVAKDAGRRDDGDGGGTIEERIAAAAGTTWQQTKRKSDARQERKNRGKGERRVSGPRDATRTIRMAIEARRAYAVRLEGEGIGEGEALARMADHAGASWKLHRKASGRGKMPAWRREVMFRHGGLCGVPGCSMEARHAHHIKYRSRGGGDEVWNLVGLCEIHHQQGVHGGALTVRGRAGERLVWRMGIAPGTAGQVWVTHGADDVRRARGEAG